MRATGFLRGVLFAVLLAGGSGLCAAESSAAAVPPKAPPAAVKAWRDAGFGIFIHWTPSVACRGRYEGKELEQDLWGEWIMRRAGIPSGEYGERIRSWNPEGFNADEWADLFARSGAKYVVFVAKHHDGFALFDSDATDYNIVDWSGFPHDPYGELVAALSRHGIRSGFYYSHGTDWRNLPGGKARKEGPEADAYFDQIVLPQLEELCSYTRPFVVWFDLGAPEPYARKCLGIIRAHNPDAIVSSRVGGGLGDFSTGKDREVPLVKREDPWETCMTLNEHWAWYPEDRLHKTPEELIRILAQVRARGGNLLLNVGPDVRGRIPLRDREILLQIGGWLRKNGDSIYGVEAPPYETLPWGVCTMKPGTLYLHIFRWPSADTLFLPGIGSPVKKAWFLADAQRQPIPVRKVEGGVRLDLAAVRLDPSFLSPADTVVALEYGGELAVRTVPCLDGDLDNTFLPDLAQCSGGARVFRFHRKSQVDGAVQVHLARRVARGFHSPDAALEWSFDNTVSNAYFLAVEYANLSSNDLRAVVQVGGGSVEVPLPSTWCGKGDPMEATRLFEIRFSKPFAVSRGRNQPLRFRLADPASPPAEPGRGKGGRKRRTPPPFMLRSIRLHPAYPR